MRLLRSAVLVSALAFCPWSAQAAPILIDFETLVDGEAVSGQLGADGILFSGATALLSGAVGGSLNEFDFPPSSGDAVVFDDGPEMRIDFATGATSVSGLFTYATPVTLTAFAGTTVLGTVTSLFDSNYASSGNTPNEQLQFAFAGGITHITLVGDPNGGSFVMDDLFVETLERETQPVPEPGTLSLLLLGASILAARQRWPGASARAALTIFPTTRAS